ncbi:DUF5666 domain-containing protein [Ramlibacter sp. Leaf400]|uniref:DUF5666 domain-containing protein n=1 Tax=Ramlibacter sp. Leaf400 TaxID=1736365 RepID=UPI0007006394|nr:DUF5666 domain-containing protein [Ramlibacter sp. Leaf400]KQT07609.1 hypothetical protein ASG30_17405 [Ramlibacter sp. Leaf400]
MKRRTLIAAVPAAVVVAGCGGGGGGGGDFGDVASIGSGGTGISGEGVGSGGTGITSAAVGSITGFGSILVNGVHFDTDRAALTLVDADTLKLGMTVQVRGLVSDDLLTGVANTVFSSADVRGTVEWVDAGLGIMKVWNTPIYIDATTVFAGGLMALHDLQPGDPVQVYGLPESGPGLRASRIERLAAEGTPVLSGSVQFVDIGEAILQIGGRRIGIIAALLEAAGLRLDQLEGQLVRIRGNAIADPLSRAEVEPWYPLRPTDGERISVEGLVTRYTSLAAMQVDGVAVDASKARVTGRLSTLGVGARVEVAGAWAGGVLAATRLKLRDAPEPEPVAPEPQPGNGNGNSNGNGNGNGGGSGSNSGSGSGDNDYSARGNISSFRSASEFRIQGQDIDAGGTGVVFEDGTAADLRNGRRVRVTGSRVANDVLIAERVEFL